MSSDAWAELQALKSKRHNRRQRLEERKKERQDILLTTLSPSKSSQNITNPLTLSQQSSSSLDLPGGSQGSSLSLSQQSLSSELRRRKDLPESSDQTLSQSLPIATTTEGKPPASQQEDESFLENLVLKTLCNSDIILHLPTDSLHLTETINKSFDQSFHHDQIVNLLQKFAVQELISIGEKVAGSGTSLEILSASDTKIQAMFGSEPLITSTRKRKGGGDGLEISGDDQETPSSEDKRPRNNDVLSLLSLASCREKENKRIGEEILELLSRPTTKEKLLSERFRSQGGTLVQEFCPAGTKSECRRVAPNNKPCSRVHFRKIIQSHTDESLGDCSFLNTCFHMENCKYVHYEVDNSDKAVSGLSVSSKGKGDSDKKDSSQSLVTVSSTVLHPPQWLHCDLRYFDMTILGKFSVIMADPPWMIHMSGLPYGTMSDDEMKRLNIPALQDEGLIFLWVTGRAMELGRDCLQLWGYERIDELIWVKTNQLQRIIRTGRTGHWLNHGKEHCLVGMKGNPPINQGLDCDIIVAEVRATSHKPDEIYGIIERLSPGTQKIELFGRAHNLQPNWITLGNQLEGFCLDDEMKERYLKRYPDGNCLQKTPKSTLP